MVRVAIAEDELLFRKGLQELLHDDHAIQFVMEAANGIELLQQLADTPAMPDVLLLDISMPGMNGFETFEQVRSKYPQIRILILSVHYSDHYITAFIEKGANGYLSKNTEPDEVKKAIVTVVKKDYYFNEDTIRVMHKNFSGKPKVLSPVSALTVREKEVLELICQEMTTGDIAEKLFISKRTADGHRNNLLLKTGCKNTAGLVVYAIRNNLFNIESQ